MCFYVSESKPEPFISTEDIKCYKTLYPYRKLVFKKEDLTLPTRFRLWQYRLNYLIRKIFYREERYFSLVRKHVYFINVPQHETIPLHTNQSTYPTAESRPYLPEGTLRPLHQAYANAYVSIERGYHSYKSRPELFNKYTVVVECIIPKGTQYYENFSEYVSSNNTIIKEV